MIILSSRTGAIVLATASSLFCAQALAAQPQNNSERGAAKRAAFLSGDASTKEAPVKQPRTEAEAVATKRELAGGIVELQLPEDRMLELTAIKRADGTIEIGHGHLDAPVAAPKEASL
ncbi:MAG: hypothetical protein M3Q51_02265 [Pseudomonadota bacterium]|nr:hypothetical protein [Pseudomonadota bacterium]MDQ3159829.1 hypothetical protein [Pseudomonadota bacterium]